VAAQSCNEQFIPNSTMADFEDHGDGTLTDHRTGLTWSRCSSGQVWQGGACTGLAAELDWESAETYARAVNQQGDLFYADWRLPNLRELASISEVNCRDPRINVEAFPATADGFYWTASRKLLEGPELAAFALSFGDEGLRVGRQAERHHVRLVRRSDGVPVARTGLLDAGKTQ
jgi:hypothetical protein